MAVQANDGRTSYINYRSYYTMLKITSSINGLLPEPSSEIWLKLSNISILITFRVILDSYITMQ